MRPDNTIEEVEQADEENYFDGSRLSSWFEVNQTGLSTV